jgi:hypothetical protein
VNSLQIHQILQTLPQYSKRTDTDRQYGDLLKKIELDVAGIYDYAASIQSLQTMQSLAEELCDRQRQNEEACSRKIDRSELGSLQSLVQTMHTYKGFKDDTLNSLALFRENTEAHARQLGQHHQELVELSAGLAAVGQKTSLLAEKEGVTALSRQLQDQLSMIKERATISDLRKVHLKISQAAEGIIIINDQHIPSIKAALADVSREMDFKASVEAVNSCVRRTHYEQAITALGSAVDAKAESEQVSRLEARLRVR